MSIKNDLSTLKTNIQNVKTKMYNNLTSKGVSVASTDTLDTMADKIDDITVGEGGGSGNPFEVIGYDTLPTYMVDGIAYGKTIYDNWDGSVSADYSNKFSGDTNIVFLPNIDLSNATKTNLMFANCVNLRYVPPLDLGNSTNMTEMFSDCTSLTDIDLSTSRPSKTTKTAGMFHRCKALRTANLSSWSMPENIMPGSMFSGCTNLVNVKLDNWYLPKATNIANMFDGCTSLGYVDFSTCQINNLTNMSYTFNACSGLTYVNFSNMDTTKITTYNATFSLCPKLEKIIGHLSVKGFTGNIAVTSFVAYTSNNILSYFTIKDIGFYSGMTSADFSYLRKWGTGDATNKATLVNSLKTYSYDRSTAGYSTCTITLSSNSKAVLSETDIAAITAKGYTIA